LGNGNIRENARSFDGGRRAGVSQNVPRSTRPPIILGRMIIPASRSTPMSAAAAGALRALVVQFSSAA
jgi:hypothetical protein